MSEYYYIIQFKVNGFCVWTLATNRRDAWKKLTDGNTSKYKKYGYKCIKVKLEAVT